MITDVESHENMRIRLKNERKLSGSGSGRIMSLVNLNLVWGCPKCSKPIIVIDKGTYIAYEDGSPIEPIGQLICQECSKSAKVK